jgi:predicted nucleotidyltransferase
LSLIDEALACLAHAVPVGTRLIVFGSRARGDADVDSDLDLLVVEPAVTERFTEMARLSALLGRGLIPADVVVMSAAHFERQKTMVNRSTRWHGARHGKGWFMNALREH